MRRINEKQATEKNKKQVKKRMTAGKIIGLSLLAVVLYLVVASTVPFAIKKTVSPESAAMLEKVSFNGNAGEAGPDMARLIETPDDAYNVRIEMLKNAQKSIDIANHMMASSDATMAFFAEVVNAADRGVQVRILLDGKTSLSPSTHAFIADLAAHPNIQCSYYNTLNILKPWDIHSFLHDKFIIVDNETLLLGGRNIHERHYVGHGTKVLTNDRDVFVWRKSGNYEVESVLEQATAYMDTMLSSDYTSLAKASKPKNATKRYEELAAAATAFSSDYPQYYVQSLQQFKNSSVETAKVTLISNPIHFQKKEPWIAWQLQQLAQNTQQTLVLQTPYATANKNTLGILATAAQNAEVNMITNSMASSPNFPAFSNYYFQRKKFLDTGVTLWEYQSVDSIHGKSMIFDDRISAVGSFNMDDRSIYIDTESMLIIDSPEFAAQLMQAINEIKASSLEVSQANEYVENSNVQQINVPAFKRFLMFLFFILLRLFQFLL